jgi:uncharacterized membrane protein
MAISRKNAIVIFLMIAVVIGIFLRFMNLHQKPYWLDETYTLLRSSGYTAREATQRLFHGQIIRAEEVLQYQHPSIEDRGAVGTIAGLATEEPQHPPLFFLLTRKWAQVFGDSKPSMRSLPAIISILTFPAIYWLSLELFAAPIVGLLAMALFAVSPIQLRYAQEVRQYSLWLTLMVLCCAVFLRAIRQPTKLNWGIYTLTIAVGLYCHLLTGLVVIAHGIYLAARERLRLTQSLIAYLASLMIGFIIFLPWFWAVLQNRDTATQTLEHFSRPLPFGSLLQFWSISLDRLWVAWHFQHNSIFIYLTIPTLAFIIYAFYFFCRHTSWQTWSFILILLGTVFLPFVISDLIWGGRRSISERYFLLCYVIIDLVVAYLLTAKLTQKFHSTLHLFWRSITGIVLSVGFVSCLSSVLLPTWWGWSEFDAKIAQIMNTAPQPIVISDVPFYAIVPFTHEIKRDTKLILLQDPNLLQIPDGFSHVFLYNPSDRLLSVLKQQNIELNLTYQFKDPMTQFAVSLYQLE